MHSFLQTLSCGTRISCSTQWPRATSSPHSSSHPPQMSTVRHVPVNAFLARLGVHFWQVPPAWYHSNFSAIPTTMAVPPPTRSGSQLCPLSLSPEGSGGSIYVDPSLFMSSWPISLLFPSPVIITSAVYYTFLCRVLCGFPS